MLRFLLFVMFKHIKYRGTKICNLKRSETLRNKIKSELDLGGGTGVYQLDKSGKATWG